MEYGTGMFGRTYYPSPQDMPAWLWNELWEYVIQLHSMAARFNFIHMEVEGVGPVNAVPASLRGVGHAHVYDVIHALIRELLPYEQASIVSAAIDWDDTGTFDRRSLLDVISNEADLTTHRLHDAVDAYEAWTRHNAPKFGEPDALYAAYNEARDALTLSLGPLHPGSMGDGLDASWLAMVSRVRVDAIVFAERDRQLGIDTHEGVNSNATS